MQKQARSFGRSAVLKSCYIYRDSLTLNIKHKVKTDAAPAMFFPKYQKAENPYPTNFSKWNYIKTASQLTHSFPMHPFSTPWKHQKTVRFFDVFSGKTKGVLGMNGLSESKYRIPVRGSALWNEFLTDSEKEIENLSLFKSKLTQITLIWKRSNLFLITFLCIVIPTSTSDKTQQHKIFANTTQ